MNILKEKADLEVAKKEEVTSPHAKRVARRKARKEKKANRNK